MTTVDQFLEHFGVKGMKWGVRRRHPSGPDSEDHQRTKELRKKRVSQLSNAELQELARRLNLENQIRNLQPPSKSKAATKFVADVLVNVGKQEATKVVGGLVAKQVANVLKK